MYRRRITWGARNNMEYIIHLGGRGRHRAKWKAGGKNEGKKEAPQYSGGPRLALTGGGGFWALSGCLGNGKVVVWDLCSSTCAPLYYPPRATFPRPRRCLALLIIIDKIFFSPTSPPPPLIARPTSRLGVAPFTLRERPSKTPASLCKLFLCTREQLL